MPEAKRELDKLEARVHNVFPRELERAAKLAGYEFDHATGSHQIYIKEGVPPLSIPKHSGAIKNGHLVRRLIRNIRESLKE